MSAELKVGDEVTYGVRTATIEVMGKAKAVIKWDGEGGPQRLEVDVADLKPWAQSPTQPNPSQSGDSQVQDLEATTVPETVADSAAAAEPEAPSDLPVPAKQDPEPAGQPQASSPADSAEPGQALAFDDAIDSDPT